MRGFAHNCGPADEEIERKTFHHGIGHHDELTLWNVDDHVSLVNPFLQRPYNIELYPDLV